MRGGGGSPGKSTHYCIVVGNSLQILTKQISMGGGVLVSHNNMHSDMAYWYFPIQAIS